jgi:hypothetical protein
MQVCTKRLKFYIYIYVYRSIGMHWLMDINGMCRQERYVCVYICI